MTRLAKVGLCMLGIIGVVYLTLQVTVTSLLLYRMLSWL